MSLAFEVLAVGFGIVFLLSTVEGDWLLAFSLVSSVVGLVALVARWRMRTYTVTAERLLLDEGVFRRRHRVVPYARVQQVNVTQELLHRLVSVAAVEVETAGEGGSSSVSLRVLRRPDAEALRAYVLERRETFNRYGVQEVVSGPRPLGRVTPAQLLLAGATGSGTLGVVAAYLIVTFPMVAIGVGEARSVWLSGPQVVVVLVVVGLIVGAAAAVVGMAVSLVQDWEWTLSEQGDDLYVRRGLLAVRSQSLPRRRIQQVTIIDNPIRRSLGVVGVALHTAAAPGSHRATVVRVPLVRRVELDGFLVALMDPAWVVPPLRPRPEPARRRAIRRRALLLAVVLGLPAVARPDALWVMLPFIALAWPWGQVAHRRAGLAVTDDLVVFAAGALRHRIDLAPRRRLQSARTSTSPLQRRAGLATQHVDLAGTTDLGPLRTSGHLFDVDEALAEQLRRELPLWDEAAGPGAAVAQ